VRRPRLGRARGLGLAAAALLAALWIVVGRPASLGGPATYVIVAGKSMEPSLHTGDLVVALRAKSYRSGDVVVFRVPPGEAGAGTPVIHRIVGGSGRGYFVRGDNRRFRDPWRPAASKLEGKSVLTIPRVGYLLVLLRTPILLAGLAGFLAFLLISGGSPADRRPKPTVLARSPR
jgi:signal peptidase